jgi:hypothetical protein
VDLGQLRFHRRAARRRRQRTRHELPAVDRAHGAPSSGSQQSNRVTAAAGFRWLGCRNEWRRAGRGSPGRSGNRCGRVTPAARARKISGDLRRTALFTSRPAEEPSHDATSDARYAFHSDRTVDCQFDEGKRVRDRRRYGHNLLQPEWWLQDHQAHESEIPGVSPCVSPTGRRE